MPTVGEAMQVRYRRQLARYRSHAATILAMAWDALPGYDEVDVPRFVERVAAPLDGAKAAAVALSVAYTAHALGTPPPAIPARAVLVEVDLRGPFTATWHALSVGRPYEEAVLTGRSVSEAAGSDFVTSTARRTGDLVARAAGRTVRWQRVPDGNACDWCIEAAAQTYATAESADIGHQRDSCLVVPA